MAEESERDDEAVEAQEPGPDQEPEEETEPEDEAIGSGAPDAAGPANRLGATARRALAGAAARLPAVQDALIELSPAKSHLNASQVRCSFPRHSDQPKA